MSRPSAVDRHPDRESILRDLALGIPLRKVAARYGVSVDSAFRAKRKLPEELRLGIIKSAIAPTEAEAAAMRDTEERALVPTMQVQRVRLMLLQDAAVERGKISVAASIAGQITKNVQATAAIVGALAPTKHVSINVTASPEYVLFRTAVLRALEGFPAARDAVLRAICGAEKTHPAPAAALPAPSEAE